jgi:hypothetical protein
MENGKYSTENYIIHYTLTANTLIMLTDKRLMFVKKAMMSHNWECDWSEEWTNCHKVSKDGLKIKITLRVLFENQFYYTLYDKKYQIFSNYVFNNNFVTHISLTFKRIVSQ